MATTANKLGDIDKLRVKELIAKLDRRGYSQFQIRDEIKRQLNLDISQPMVGIYRRQMIRECLESTKLERTERVSEGVAHLRDVRREAWLAYDRSHEDATETVEEFAEDKEEVGLGDYVTSERRIKRIEKRRGRLPDNAYLNTVMQTLAAERELLGLDELKSNMVTLEQVMVVIGAFRDAVREVLEGQPALLKAIMQRTVHLMPVPSEKESA